LSNVFHIGILPKKGMMSNVFRYGRIDLHELRVSFILGATVLPLSQQPRRRISLAPLSPHVLSV
jgi:hypothetical protein